MSDMFKDKDVINLPDNYKDDRGFIQPICDLNMKSASLIISKKNCKKRRFVVYRPFNWSCNALYRRDKNSSIK